MTAYDTWLTTDREREDAEVAQEAWEDYVQGKMDEIAKEFASYCFDEFPGFTEKYGPKLKAILRLMSGDDLALLGDRLGAIKSYDEYTNPERDPDEERDRMLDR